MDNYTLESFIEYCDDMMIAEEGKIFDKIKRVINNTINKKLVNSKKRSSTPANKGTNQNYKYMLKKASSSDFNRLYNKEAYCAEGMTDVDTDENAIYLANFFGKKDGAPDELHFYYCYGKDLNNYYHLTGNNQYPDNLGIFFIDWTNFDTNKFDVALNKGKFRYFSDVVDNNARREIRKSNPAYNNYHSLYGDEWFYSTI